MKRELISIIIPVYNAEKYIKDTINSVLNQTYKNWELILIDDCSTDESVKIIEDFKKNDKRIKLLKNKINSKVAITRNNGIKVATGSYLCFLDADDLWVNDKLEKQIKFMKEHKCEFSFTGYEFADEYGVPNGKKVFIPEKINYKTAIKKTTISTITVMFDMTKLDKEDIYMPNVGAEDTATWWKVLKKVKYAYGLNEILSFYRRTPGTLSSNKFVAIKRVWYLYRKVEKFNVIKSFYYFCFYILNAVKRRV